MPALPLQLRLEPYHVAAIDAASRVTDPQSGLTVGISRQQVILGILDQWIAAHAVPPPEAAPPAPVGVDWTALDRVALAARAQALRNEGTSHAKIAALFTSEGIPTPGGKGKQWSNSAVERLLRFGLQEDA